MNFIEVPICSYQAYQQNQAYFPDWEIGMKLGFFRLQVNYLSIHLGTYAETVAYQGGGQRAMAPPFCLG